MNQRSLSHLGAVAAVYSLLSICASAQASQTSGSNLLRASDPRIVPLVSDACPVVRSGDKVSLDWNPGFEHAGIVSGLRAISLRFGSVGGNGVTVSQIPTLRLGGLAVRLLAAPTVNGYFHLEFPVPVGSRPGLYHLISAEAYARTMQEYQGPELPMTNSPVNARFCVTVMEASFSPS